MPVKIAKKGNKFRLVESSTGRIAKNQGGTAIDGGGRASKAALEPQRKAVNASLQRKKT